MTSTTQRPFRVLGIQQIAIGGRDKRRLRALWQDALGLEMTGTFRSERENVDEDILAIGSGATKVEVDLMQPVDEEKKPAVHATPLNHVGLWIDDLPAAVQWLGAQGVRFAPGGIRKGAAGYDITFLHPKGNDEFPVSGEGVLIELVQAPPEVIAALGGAAAVADPQAAPSPQAAPAGQRRGLIIVHTGNGKGKSTAAFGLAMRAHGRGKAVKIWQFMKVPTARFGEHRAFEKLGLDVEGLGDGFSWKSRDLEHSAQLARQGWQKARAGILGGEYFMVVLDELTYPLNFGWLPLDEVVQTLQNRPRDTTVVITGRDCPQALVEMADTVTEMRQIRHAYERGIPAQRGIED